MKYLNRVLHFQLLDEELLSFHTFISLTILLVFVKICGPLAKIIVTIKVHWNRKIMSNVITIQPHNVWLSTITFMFHWIHIIGDLSLLPHWFKAGFLLKILEIFRTQFVKDNVTLDELQVMQNWTLTVNSENLETVEGVWHQDQSHCKVKVTPSSRSGSRPMTLNWVQHQPPPSPPGLPYATPPTILHQITSLTKVKVTLRLRSKSHPVEGQGQGQWCNTSPCPLHTIYHTPPHHLPHQFPSFLVSVSHPLPRPPAPMSHHPCLLLISVFSEFIISRSTCIWFHVVCKSSRIDGFFRTLWEMGCFRVLCKMNKFSIDYAKWTSYRSEILHSLIFHLVRSINKKIYDV